ncbi:MAG: hypothetical protein MZV70_37430 [Desulfobacterales bacterium]|nr:hypothetical protein [Desulfobacterales bacterium]
MTGGSPRWDAVVEPLRRHLRPRPGAGLEERRGRVSEIAQVSIVVSMHRESDAEDAAAHPFASRKVLGFHHHRRDIMNQVVSYKTARRAYHPRRCRHGRWPRRGLSARWAGEIPATGNVGPRARDRCQDGSPGSESPSDS